MSNLAGPWAGNIYGTNTGRVFIEFEQERMRRQDPLLDGFRDPGSHLV
ncbi:MAG TPA: hypothetical protein VI750_09290 [Pyrinomonadaceae bacterium]|nr:hypothetical protein [Pyrinomonadaceae bacterium]